jgi:hypothetical protein
VNGGSARLRILYEHAISVGPRSNSFSPIRRRALGLPYRTCHQPFASMSWNFIAITRAEPC